MTFIGLWGIGFVLSYFSTRCIDFVVILQFVVQHWLIFAVCTAVRAGAVVSFLVGRHVFMPIMLSINGSGIQINVDCVLNLG